MYETRNKIVAVVLALVLICSFAGVGALAASGGASAANETPAPQPQAQPLSALSALQEEVTKDETVYVIAGADGTVEKIIVSDWLKGSAQASEIQDISNLTGASVVKGDASCTMTGGSGRVWDAKGGDVYYQGNIEKELPVMVSVSYTLDGAPISPEDLAGKSGRVTIRFDYENTQYETVDIDGRQERIYVPFAMLTGLLLDSDHFTNVSVSNGKLIHDGDRTATIGLAFPGLQENLNLDAEKMELPDYVEITADATDFELTTTFTVATNSVFSELDSEELNDLDDLGSDLDRLTDAMEQLIDGSSRLYDGLCTLLEKSGDLIDGIDQLAAGAKALRSGGTDLADGAAQLQSGAATLSEGLQTLSGNNAALQGGAKQVFDTLLGEANRQLQAAGLAVSELTVENYSDVLAGVLAQLGDSSAYAENAARQQVAQAVEERRAEVRQGVTAAVEQEVSAQVSEAVKAQVWQQVLAGAGMTQEQYDAGVVAGAISGQQQAQLQSVLEQAMAGTEVQAQQAAALQGQMESEEIQTLIDQKTEEQIALLVDQNMASQEVQAQIQAGAAQADAGAAAIRGLKEQLDSYAQFYNGLISYTDGVAQAAQGAAALTDGTNSLQTGAKALQDGAGQLYDGLLSLQDGSSALVDGMTQLRDGAGELSDGLKEFNEKGVQKLVDAVDGDLGGLLTRIQATLDVSQDYTNFSGIPDGMDGTVRFIYRTASIETEN